MKTVIEFLEGSLLQAKEEADSHRKIFHDFTEASLKENYRIAGLPELTRNVTHSFAMVDAHVRLLAEAKDRENPSFQWAVSRVKDIIADLAFDVRHEFAVNQIAAYRRLLTSLQEKV